MNEKHRDYALYAEHCLNQVASAPDRKARRLLREMAAEWLNLAEQAETRDTVVVSSRSFFDGLLRAPFDGLVCAADDQFVGRVAIFSAVWVCGK